MIELIIYFGGILLGIIAPFVSEKLYNELKDDEEYLVNYIGCFLIWPMTLAVILVGLIFMGISLGFQYLLKKR